MSEYVEECSSLSYRTRSRLIAPSINATVLTGANAHVAVSRHTVAFSFELKMEPLRMTGWRRAEH